MNRWTAMLMAGALIAAATPALAEKIGPASKAFPYLEKFLKVPPAERSKLRLSYGLSRDGKPLSNLKATLIEPAGARTPLPVDAAGAFERLPTLAQLESGSKLALDLPEDAKIGSSLNFGTQIKPASEYEVAELAATVDQAGVVIGKVAGAAALLAPKMTGIVFSKAEGGVAIFADGRTQPLPEMQDSPYFRPDDFKGAVRVKLTKSPTKVGFYAKKK